MNESLAMGQHVIRMEADALLHLAQRLDHQFSEAVSIMRDALARRSKIVIVGVGKSGNIGHKIAATLNSTGAPCVVLNSQNALHGDLGVIADGDIAIVMSYSGETPELLLLLPHLKRACSSIIAMTGNLSSTLAEHADLLLDTSVEREACPLNLAPTSSSTAMLVLGDALAMALLDARGFTDDDFAKYHPGGSLGRALLTKVADIMRTGSAVATAPNTATIATALLAMTHARSGACVILADDGTLAGVFTHGDFVRAFQREPLLAERAVADFMTRNPVTVMASALAVKAVNMIGSHRIDDVVVLGDDGRPVGLVDTQDLAHLRLV